MVVCGAEAVAFVDEALVEGSAVAEPGQGVLHRAAYQALVLTLLAFAVDLRASGCEPTDPLVPALPGQARGVGAGDRSDSRVASLLDQHRGPFSERPLIRGPVDAGELSGGVGVRGGHVVPAGLEGVMGEPEEDLHPRQPVQAAVVVRREVVTQLPELFDLILTGGPHQDQAGQPADPQLDSPGVRQLDLQVLGAVAQQLLGLLVLAHLEQGRRPPEPVDPTVELDDRAQHLEVAEREQFLGAVVHLVAELPQAEARHTRWRRR